jgi:hypothetical protein
VKATEILEELERGVHEFGDGEGEYPDPLQAGWWNKITRIEYEPGDRRWRFISDD